MSTSTSLKIGKHMSEQTGRAKRARNQGITVDGRFERTVWVEHIMILDLRQRLMMETDRMVCGDYAFFLFNSFGLHPG